MIFNMTGGGSGSGATLVVSCPANVTVTVSKDDKSYTKNSGNLGSATFKGLATGEWTVTIEGNEQTETKNITITADYAITIAFFSAYINITYPANSTCVVQTSGGATVASDSNTDSSTKTWMVTVNSTGTYTVTATATDGSEKSKSTTVSITADGQSNGVTLNYEVYYYNNGDVSSLTGGWNNATAGEFLSAKIKVRSDGYAQSLIVTSKNTIDLAGINTIHVIGTMEASGQYSSAKFSIGGASVSVSGGTNTTNDLTDFSLDVSGVSSGQFTFTLNSGGNYSSINISKIYGE